MNILVTGGLGYIGSHATVELLSAGHRVVIVDSLVNSSTSMVDNIIRASSCKNENISVYVFDVSDKIRLLDFMRSQEPFDLVIHFAAYKSAAESIVNPLKYYENNLDALMSLLSCMKEVGLDKIIFSSSAAVYQPGDTNTPLLETSQLGPLNPYGRTKLMAEQIITDVVSCGDISAIILRYFNPCGAHPSGFIGESFVATPTNLVPVICNAAKTGSDIKIFGNDYDTPCGTAIRDYIHVVDVASAHLKSAEKIMSSNLSYLEVLNIGTGRGYSVLEILNTFNYINSTNVGYEFLPRREGDSSCVYASAQLAKESLGWQASLSLSHMLQSAWNWHKTHC